MRRASCSSSRIASRSSSLSRNCAVSAKSSPFSPTIAAPALQRVADQAVRVERVGLALDLVESEIDADRFADIDHHPASFLDQLGRAEFLDVELFGRDTAGRHIGIELERPPRLLHRQVGTHRQRALETPLADEAPGTDYVDENIDSHVSALPERHFAAERLALHGKALAAFGGTAVQPFARRIFH